METKTPTLAEQLLAEKDGHADTDVAMFFLSRCLGILPPDATFAESKAFVYAQDSHYLYETLISLAQAGYLEKDEDGFRWIGKTA